MEPTAKTSPKSFASAVKVAPKDGAPIKQGMAIGRRFTTPGSDPLEEVKYEKRLSSIKNPDGSTV
ncbi:MAG: hypothetical protein QF809_05335, partial [Candidatus Peribacteraceae bacterium]|nr:hypothetical protein [Candidatus Peribacteraceae bacterium]